MASDLDDIVVPKDLAVFVHGFARAAAPGKDSQRFGRLVLPHLKQAYALARWITGDRIGAGHVVRQACAHVLRMTAPASDCNARTLVLAAVRNAAAAWLRKYRSVALVPTEEFGPSERKRRPIDASDPTET
jgi:DNA-directed RNA polymerase specialized sigma24 family protein